MDSRSRQQRRCIIGLSHADRELLVGSSRQGFGSDGGRGTSFPLARRLMAAVRKA
jgi:hypothetical protein